MNLLDHFHPPLSNARHWESFHAQWAGSITGALNESLLPPEYFAETQVHIGSRVEIDVATFDSTTARQGDEREQGAGRVATLAPRVWSPPAPAWSIPAIFPDGAEVLVYRGTDGPTLVAAIELVSPGNKDRDEYRRAFAIKCTSLLQQGVSLAVIDIVTNRSANLHNDLIELLGSGERFALPADRLYATAYRPSRTSDEERIDVWTLNLLLGASLPTLPLPLDRQLIVPLDLGATYGEACHRSRIG